MAITRNKFEIIVPLGAPISRAIGASLDGKLRGCAFQEKASSAGTVEIAQEAGVYVGFVTRDIVAARTLSNAVFDPAEGPFVENGYVTLQDAMEVEVESSASGFNHLTMAGTPALGDPLTFDNGGLKDAASTNRIQFRVSQVLTADVSGQKRVRARRVFGEIAA